MKISPRIALGTAQFGLSYGIANRVGQVTKDDASEILQLAVDNKIDTLDTAIAYGESELRLGEIGIQDWKVVSKLPPIPKDCSDISGWIKSVVLGSLGRLNVGSLYGLLLHRPHQLTEANGDRLYVALQQLKQDGLVQKIGISVYDTAELDTICSRFQLDLVQAPFNILDNRLIDTNWLNRFAELDIELHVRSIFLQGLLLMPSVDRPSKFAHWSNLWSAWDNWLSLCQLSPLQACLRYVLSFPQISKAIVGIDSPRQLREVLLASVGGPVQKPDGLSTSDLRLINPANWTALSPHLTKQPSGKSHPMIEGIQKCT